MKVDESYFVGETTEFAIGSISTGSWRVSVAATGVQPYRLFDGLIHRTRSIVGIVRFGLRSEKSWTLSIGRRDAWGERDVLERVHPSRSDAMRCAEWALEFLDPKSPLSVGVVYGYDGVRRRSAKTSDGDESVVDAVRRFREAGWFSWCGRASDSEVAGRLADAWQARDWRPWELRGPDVDLCLLVLDSHRSWCGTMVSVDDGCDLALSLSVVALTQRGEGTLMVSGLKQDKNRASGDVVVDFDLDGSHVSFAAPAPSHYPNPAIVAEVNRLLPPQLGRLWYVESGPSIGVVTRATEEERQLLHSVSELRLTPDPPPLWEG